MAPTRPGSSYENAPISPVVVASFVDASQCGPETGIYEGRDYRLGQGCGDCRSAGGALIQVCTSADCIECLLTGKFCRSSIRC